MYRVDYWKPTAGKVSKSGFTSRKQARKWAVVKLPMHIIWSVEKE